MDDQSTREPSSHPSPGLRSSSSMSVQAPQYEQAPEAYRARHAPGEQNSISQAPLPSIHHFDGQQGMQPQPQPQYAQMQQPPQQQQQHPPPYPPNQYQYQNGVPPAAPMQSNGATNGQNGGMMRFPIPPQPAMDARQMSGGRHKKEIKRRTKTGCMTCRKRRIKCDEGQPTCRNCSKSKRECLGYDPIFKQQPTPANIQPAPTGNNPPPNPAAPPSLPTNPYSTPQSYPGTGGTFVAAPCAPYGEQQQPPYETNGGSSLDPALSTGDQPLHMAHNNYPPALQPHRRVKHVAIEDLFSLNDIPPRFNVREAPPPVSPSTQTDMEAFFKHHYAQGLDRLFETTWYWQRGLGHLQRDLLLQDFVAQCAEQFKTRPDESGGKPLLSLEARLVWVLAAMARSAASNGAGGDPVLQELLPRIDTMECLLTGQYLEPNKVPPPPQQPPSDPNQDHSVVNQKYNERTFWYHLARFVSIRDDNPAALEDVSDALLALRGNLNMLENRDVLYSLAVARHIGGRMPDFHPQRQLVASTNDSSDDVNKLKVAHQFIENEDQRGTTQAIQRICSMSIRGWILQKQ